MAVYSVNGKANLHIDFKNLILINISWYNWFLIVGFILVNMSKNTFLEIH